MTIVVDGLQLVNSKRRLPKEAFFVDTNVVIDILKSMGTKTHGSLSVVLEYYKNMQVGYYKVQLNKEEFDLSDFKKLRDGDSRFSDGWQHQMESMKKTFRKNFPLYEASLDGRETLATFTGISADFGDHLLFKTVMAAPREMWCIFSNDSDFYSFTDELYLLTTNNAIIQRAQKEKKLYQLLR